MADFIHRQHALDVLSEVAIDNFSLSDSFEVYLKALNDVSERIKKIPSAQPESSEITDEQAILHLQSTGWMQNHDCEMYEMWLKEQLKDGKGDCTGCNFQGWYDTDFPCVNCVRKIKDYFLSAERGTK